MSTDITTTQALDWAIVQLHHPEAERDAMFLLAEIMQQSIAGLKLSSALLTKEQWAQFQSWIHLRQQHMPVSQIIGTQPFWRWDFHVNKYVLTPRADSECLIEAALNHWQVAQNPLHVLDLGTGSGCLLLSLMSELPQIKLGIGVDISDDALQMAQHNQSYLMQQGAQLPENIQWILGSWDAALDHAPFDIILANPPYIGAHEKTDLTPDVLNFEPHTALFAHQEGYGAYAEIFPLLSKLLSADGKAYIEHGYKQQDSLCTLASDAGLKVEQRLTDLAKNPRGLVLSK